MVQVTLLKCTAAALRLKACYVSTHLRMVHSWQLVVSYAPLPCTACLCYQHTTVLDASAHVNIDTMCKSHYAFQQHTLLVHEKHVYSATCWVVSRLSCACPGGIAQVREPHHQAAVAPAAQHHDCSICEDEQYVIQIYSQKGLMCV